MIIHPYRHPLYAKAFAYDYEALYLKEADTYVLLRPIAGTAYVDAMGVYPLCPMNADADIEKDFATLRQRNAISLVFITDPFFHLDLEDAQRHFDSARPFKEHFVCNLEKDHIFSKHHRYEIKSARKHCETSVIKLEEHLDAWYELYCALIDKHRIAGIQAFPKRYFADICALSPIMIGAFHDGILVSAHIWFRHHTYAYSHLAASSEQGYLLGAAYAVYDHSIRYLHEQGVCMIDLGGGAGNEASAGLSAFKKGFSNDSIMCHLRGKILNEPIYAELSRGKKSDYFPLYRAP
jgi:hypothetical protein